MCGFVSAWDGECEGSLLRLTNKLCNALRLSGLKRRGADRPDGLEDLITRAHLMERPVLARRTSLMREDEGDEGEVGTP